MIFICGEICSGKTHYGTILAKGLDVPYIEASTIVKQILRVERREELQGNPQLDKEIIKCLSKQSPECVIGGVRQASILQAFKTNSSFIWLEVPHTIRLKRCLERKDQKDILSPEAFQQAEQKDNELGLQEVKNYILNKGNK